MIERTIAARPTASTRYFDASGADLAGCIGELRDNETHLVTRTMMALQDHVVFAVFGAYYDTPDGTAIRDYIHVTDLAAAHVAVLKLLEAGHADGSFTVPAWAWHQKAHPRK